MRLEPAEAAQLPLPAALFETGGRLLAATPEWAGAGPAGGTLYLTGQGHLVVAPDVPTPELDVLVEALLESLRAALRGRRGGDASRAEVLAAGLQLVAGRPALGTERARVERVVELALAAIAGRSQDLVVEVRSPLPNVEVPSPAAVALALTQLAVNAEQHSGARRVALRVAAGPTFYVEWAGPHRGTVPVDSHRHPLRRDRWGWAYVQMVVDSLGATALPPGPTGPGLVGACLGLGSVQLTLPLARVEAGRIERSTLAWDQDSQVPRFGEPLRGLAAGLVETARQRPGEVAYVDLYRARAQTGHAWLALAPEAGSNRARDLLRGLAHERALWTAPEPHATRLQALASLIGVALGDRWPTVPPAVWAELAPAAGAALGVSLPVRLDTVAPPDPRLVALLLAELGGRLVQRGEQVYVEPSPTGTLSRLAPALRRGPEGWIQVNP